MIQKARSVPTIIPCRRCGLNAIVPHIGEEVCVNALKMELSAMRRERQEKQELYERLKRGMREFVRCFWLKLGGPEFGDDAHVRFSREAVESVPPDANVIIEQIPNGVLVRACVKPSQETFSKR